MKMLQNDVSYMEEIWRDIEGYEGLYQVSNLGRIKSFISQRNKKEKILHPSNDKDGYLFIGLYKNGNQKPKRVHRIVAGNFIPNTNNKPQVNHINGDKKDNRVENLEWCTCKENIVHAWEEGLHKLSKEHHKKMVEAAAKVCSKPVMQFTIEGEYINEFSSANKAAKSVNGFHPEIIRCCRGIIKSYNGFIWKFKITDYEDVTE